MMRVDKHIQKLGRFLAYVLGRQPDEFGLVPNTRGFVTTKELLKALHQETGWRHVRMSHLHQLFAILRPAPIEFDGNLIRARNRARLPAISNPVRLPKLLYLAIRRRAYDAALTKGLKAGSRPYLVLSSDRAMAQKIGQRLDHEPVILTVQVAPSQSKGTRYRQYGRTLYLADVIAPNTFTGPTPPKAKTSPEKSTPKAPQTPKTPGSYFPELGPTPEEKQAFKRERRRHKMVQDKARRQARRQKSPAKR